MRAADGTVLIRQDTPMRELVLNWIKDAILAVAFIGTVTGGVLLAAVVGGVLC